jgi:hypothetical protein
MKTSRIAALVIFVVAMSLATSTARAQYSVFTGTINGNQFPTSPLNSSGTGSLTYTDSIANNDSGLGISTGVEQNFNGPNSALGETFYWSGATTKLTAASFVQTFGGGSGQYQPFLFDLGNTQTYGGSNTTFVPNNYTNLLPLGEVQPPALGNNSYVDLEVDFTTPITLLSGHSYAYGFQNIDSITDSNFQKTAGGQSDSDGEGFVFTGNLNSTDPDTPVTFESNPRNLFLGLYTAPEPTSLSLLSLGAIGFLSRRRRGS